MIHHSNHRPLATMLLLQRTAGPRSLSGPCRSMSLSAPLRRGGLLFHSLPGLRPCPAGPRKSPPSRCPNAAVAIGRGVKPLTPSSSSLSLSLSPRLARCFSVTSRTLDEDRRSSSSPSPQRAPRLRKVLQALPTAHEDIYTLPNLLTVSRLIAAPFVGYCILHDHHAWALGLFAYAGVTDLLDGWIARRWNSQTVVGTVIDPMADKTLMTVLTVTLAIKGGLPLWLAVIILGRDVGLGIAAIYYRWISLPPPKTFTRYWDFSLPSAEVRPTTISKYNTFLQLALMGVTTMAPVVPLDVGTPLTIMQYVVAATTAWSGASYVFSKDAVKILSQAEIDEKIAEGKSKDDVDDKRQ